MEVGVGLVSLRSVVGFRASQAVVKGLLEAFFSWEHIKASRRRGAFLAGLREALAVFRILPPFSEST